ncbi:MAG: COG1470 family protein [Sedimentisphaerales bacterium]
MKKVITIMVVLTLALATASKGADSPKGGSVGKGEGFKIDVPTFDVRLKQGETQSIAIKLQRGESFKQDVKLQIKAAKGISIDPAKVLVKSSDIPEVQLAITIPNDAAIGDYVVNVIGTPETGELTSVEFKVKVLAMDVVPAAQSEPGKSAAEPMRKCTAGCMKTCQANMEDIVAAKAAIKAAIAAIDNGDTATAKNEMEKADKLLSNVHKGMKENMQKMPCCNVKCPIEGKSIDRMGCSNELTRTHKGMKVGFCCAACPSAWDNLTDGQKDDKLKDAMPSKE